MTLNRLYANVERSTKICYYYYFVMKKIIKYLKIVKLFYDIGFDLI